MIRGYGLPSYGIVLAMFQDFLLWIPKLNMVNFLDFWYSSLNKIKIKIKECIGQRVWMKKRKIKYLVCWYQEWSDIKLAFSDGASPANPTFIRWCAIFHETWRSSSLFMLWWKQTFLTFFRPESSCGITIYNVWLLRKAIQVIIEVYLTTTMVLCYILYSENGYLKRC
ncbi:hypothetical protein CsatB_016508 [Cannabis sativa]